MASVRKCLIVSYQVISLNNHVENLGNIGEVRESSGFGLGFKVFFFSQWNRVRVNCFLNSINATAIVFPAVIESVTTFSFFFFI